MRKLLPQQYLSIWEKCLNAPQVLHANIILTVGYKSEIEQDISTISLSNRNYYLLKLREYNFGSVMNCLAQCGSCAEKLEFPLNTKPLYENFNPKNDANDYQCILDDYQITCRVLQVQDMYLSSQQTDLEKARIVLLERSITQILHQGKQIDITKLPEKIIDKLIELMQEENPLSEICLNLNCPNCENNWKANFDIGNFIFEEITAHAKEILNEIHTLALHYSWSEAEILELTDNRRQFYLSQLNA